ncbi:hypothetical protein PAALTS15_17506 [Paenibacillus alvei TS-15]|uniref:Uncharacterized protein n=1 Tax=Paenibacillus alvei TS-15 TaxID=1117108 RepID=S9TU73_PAEAL|nr:sigma-70 family RNA polymerase sigma factor [Paenibacillus alvei]EPY05876.1 hypothetical protein PAALTS15_17506 [Paenibacillus alvei TS-15]
MFVKAHLKLSSVKKPDKLGNWLFTVTTRECIDWLRTKKNTEAYERVDDVSIPMRETTEEQWLRKELCQEV